MYRCATITSLHLALVAVLIVVGGCRTARVRVLDAESGEPIGKARIVPYYSSNVLGWDIGPPGDPVFTRRDGRATLGTSLFNSFSGFQAYADGYVPWRTPKNVIFTRDPGTPVGSEVLLYLYQEPAPRALLTIPNDYRGPLLIARPKEVDLPLSIHLRVHEFVVRDPAAPTVVPAAPPLHMTRTSRIQVRYPDGRPLPNCPDFLRPAAGGTQVFELEKYSEPQVLFVGEAEEFRVFRQTVNHPSGRFWDFNADALKRESESAVRRWSQAK